jgi:hypothetical protein
MSTPTPKTPKTRILPRNEWPQGAEPDGKLYSLESSRAMRAVMAENDTSSDIPALDADGAFIWTPVMHGSADFDEPITDEPMTGTLAEVGHKAAVLNAAQYKMWGNVPWIYAPALIEKLAA